jgi:dihydrofolate reductase
MSSTITAFQSITVDGVMQGPGRDDEDPRGGFTHGGWTDGYQDEVLGAFVAEGLATPTALLFGRRTYEDVLGYWTSTSDPNPFSSVLVDSPKYVVSRSTDTDLRHPNSELLAGDAVQHVVALRERSELPLMVMGSGELVRVLHAAGLIDGYVLLIHPIVLGSGTRLFGVADRVDLELERVVPTTTGVLIAHYGVVRDSAAAAGRREL